MADTNTYISKRNIKKYTTQEKFDALDKSGVPVGTEYNIVLSNPTLNSAVCMGSGVDGKMYYKSLSTFSNLYLKKVNVDDFNNEGGNKLWLEAVQTEYGYSVEHFTIMGGGMSNNIYSPDSTTVASTTSGFIDGATVELVSGSGSQGTIIFHVGASSSEETALGSFSVDDWTYISVEKILSVYNTIVCVIKTDGTVKTL